MFYQVRAYRVSLREFWWENKFLIWVALIIKILRASPRASTDDLAVDSLAPFQIDAGSVAPESLEKIHPILVELQECGFNGSDVWHHENDPYQVTRNTLATVAHDSGSTMARVQCRVTATRVPPKVKLFTTLITPTRDGGYLVTTNGRPDMAWPKSHELERHRDLPTPALWKRHQARLSEQRAVLPKISSSALDDAAEAYHVSLRDFHLARGVFAPVPESEASLYAPPPLDPAAASPPALGSEAMSQPQPPEQPADVLEAATFAELQRIQRKSNSWTATIAILAISVVLFILSFRQGTKPSSSGENSDWFSNDWQFIPALLTILFIHESGHYLAMRGFGYRNLKMFFIPFFGAAVSGNHYKVPGWKKVIVSLMGPVPGILLGAVAGIVGVALNKDWLTMAGLLSLIINGFNLLPILPFDGGWVAHAVLFSRHYLLDAGFRILAALALFGMSMTGPGEKFLMYIGIAMLLSLPASMRQAKVVGELRAEGFSSNSPDGNSIPPSAARTILAKLRQRSRGVLTPKLAAQQTLKIFETLNARPPGAWASVGFIALHGGSFLLALIFAVGIIGFRQLKQSGRLGDFSGIVDPARLHPMDPAQIRSSVIGELPAECHTIVLPMKDASAAEKMAQALPLPADAPAARRVTIIGHVVLVSIPATDQDTRNHLLDTASSDKDAFVETGEFGAMFSLACQAPSEAAATRITDELQGYLGHAGRARINPPWATESDWPAEKRAADEAARALLRKLEQGPRDDYKSPEWIKLIESRDQARRRGDTATVAELQKKIAAWDEDSRADFQKRMREAHPNSELVEKYFALYDPKDYKNYSERFAVEIGPMLGLWSAEKPAAFLAQQGYAHSTGTRMNLVAVRFVRSDAGMPALIQWLAEHGCTKFQLDVRGVPVGNPGDEFEDEI